MRSALLTCAAILVLGLGAFAYLWFQPAVAERPSHKILVEAPTTRPQSSTKISGLGTVESAWIIRIDPSTGELASRFRGDRYDPQPDNTVLVDHPVAEFFAQGGKQRFYVTGKSGRVYVSGVAASQRPGQFEGKMEPPSRGQLHDVVIEMYEPADDPEPTLTIAMNNAAFNNEELRIETEAFTDSNGNRVAADQVPVTVRGRDYDFDGRGMVMKWNERDRKLQLLEIAHGEQLVIKNPKMLERGEVVNVPLHGPQAIVAPVPVHDEMAPDAHASATVRSAAKKPATRRRRRPATDPATQPKRGETPTVYRASFNDQVRVVQAGKQLAAADVIHVNFLRDARKPSTQQATTSTSTTNETSPARKERTAATEPLRAAATESSDQPITIRWTGKLRVVPVDGPVPANLLPGTPEVQLIGNPVQLAEETTQIQCAIASYNSGDQSADLRGSDTVPLVRMTDASGLVVHTPQMQYQTISPREKIATLIGPSTAKIPSSSDGAGTVRFIDAKWRDECELRLLTDERKRTYIEHADLTGTVVVDDPRMNLTSDRIELAFIPVEQKQATPTAKPSRTVDVQPKQMIASGNVHAKLRDDKDGEQTIAGEKLTVDTELDARGQTYARRFEIDGKVHSVSREGELTSDHLVAMLKPSTRPSASTTRPTGSSPFEAGEVELESLVAERNVRFATTQGAVASGDTLKILTEDQLQRIHLIGSTTRPATIVNNQTQVTGERMRFTPDAKLAEVPGPGTMRATSQPSRKGGGLPGSAESVDLAWQGGAIINGVTNLVDITDGVVVNMKQTDGTANTATSNRLQATLVDQAPKRDQDTKNQRELMGAKDIGSATLSGNVEVTSEMLGAGGELIRGFNLFTETVKYDRLADRMTVPVEGTMLHEDRRPAKRTDVEGPTVGSGRGKTAFKWKKSLIYEGAQRAVTLSGDVAIVHRPQRREEQPFRLDAQTVIAELEAKRDEPAEAVAASGNSGTTSLDENVQVKLITARDQVRVSSSKMSFDAYELTYSPIQTLLTARGSDHNPGTIYNSDSGSTGSFKSLEWNTETDQFKITNARGRVRR